MNLTYPAILDRIARERAGIIVHIYSSDAIPTVRVLEDGSMVPATYRTHIHTGTRYMREDRKSC